MGAEDRTNSEETHEKGQAYFWSESWQQAERDADRDIAEGCVETFETGEDSINTLDHDGAESSVRHLSQMGCSRPKEHQSVGAPASSIIDAKLNPQDNFSPKH